ncbi:hypothetical protein MUP59_07045 [Candidatus Bathyarchaeota archaeon]|nr:hypothetical protein [Candidatus Bathyarchaeota archaeon]
MVRRAKIGKKKTKAEEKSLPPVKCKGCMVNFTPKDRRQHFHSALCREAYYQRTYFGKTSARKICPNCGTEFPTTKPGSQTYCTPECREDTQKKRREGLSASVTTERKTFLGDRFTALEATEFKCSYCGKGAHDGVKLDVEENGKGGLRTVCNLCVEGREFNKGGNDNVQPTKDVQQA